MNFTEIDRKIRSLEMCLESRSAVRPEEVLQVGIEQVFEEELALRVFKPANPLLVTPLGIALNCTVGNGANYVA